MCKKFYKKCDILFWFAMMFLPVFISIIVTIAYCCNYKLTGVTPTSSTFGNDVVNCFGLSFSNWSNFIPSFITGTFTQLFGDLSINTTLAIPLIICLSWFVWVVFLHLIVDILAFAPKFFHKFIRRVNSYDE